MPQRIRVTTPDSRGTSRYRLSLRAAIRGLWLGAFDRDEFFDQMTRSVERNLTIAWHSGAAECGIAPDELTQEELNALDKAIDYELLWIGGFATTIEANSKAKKGKVTPLLTRAEIWLGRWEGVRAKAKTMACGNQKLKWVVGPTEHCNSCIRLNGKVKRASWWSENNVLPRVHGAPWLACKGFR